MQSFRAARKLDHYESDDSSSVNSSIGRGSYCPDPTCGQDTIGFDKAHGGSRNAVLGQIASPTNSTKVRNMEAEITKLKKKCAGLQQDLCLVGQSTDVDDELKHIQEQLRLSKSQAIIFASGVPKVAKHLQEAVDIFNDEAMMRREEAVQKAYNFFHTCKGMAETADDSLVDMMNISLQGSAQALNYTVKEYLTKTSIETIARVYKAINAAMEETTTCPQKKAKGEMVQDIQEFLQTYSSSTKHDHGQSAQAAVIELAYVFKQVAVILTAEGSAEQLPSIGLAVSKARSQLEKETRLQVEESKQDACKATAMLAMLQGARSELKRIMCTYRVNYELANEVCCKWGFVNKVPSPEKYFEDVQQQKKKIPTTIREKEGKNNSVVQATPQQLVGDLEQEEDGLSDNLFSDGDESEEDVYVEKSRNV